MPPAVPVLTRTVRLPLVNEAGPLGVAPALPLPAVVFAAPPRPAAGMLTEKVEPRAAAGMNRSSTTAPEPPPPPPPAMVPLADRAPEPPPLPGAIIDTISRPITPAGTAAPVTPAVVDVLPIYSTNVGV